MCHMKRLPRGTIICSAFENIYYIPAGYHQCMSQIQVVISVSTNELQPDVYYVHTGYASQGNVAIKKRLPMHMPVY